MRGALIWVTLLAAIGVPLALAAASPFLAFRDWVYIGAGFAGIAALCLLLLQPLLAATGLPGLGPSRARKLHRVSGAMLLALILAHIGGLWLTSPPDVIDALTFTSPTPFSTWGVLAMWAAIATALMALVRCRLGWRAWRITHSALALIIAGGTTAHALLIEGAMEPYSKVALCFLVGAVTLKVLLDPKALRRLFPS